MPPRSTVTSPSTCGRRCCWSRLSPAGIAVNALNPGPTDTGLLGGDAYEEIRARFPGGRWGTPADAARAVAWLASDDAAWINGQTLDAEGGFRR